MVQPKHFFLQYKIIQYLPMTDSLKSLQNRYLKCVFYPHTYRTKMDSIFHGAKGLSLRFRMVKRPKEVCDIIQL